MGKNQINLEMDIVDLGDGNGNSLHQLQPLRYVGIMALEVFLMEFPHCAGWILAYYSVGMKKDKSTAGLKSHPCQSQCFLKCKESYSLRSK